MSNDLDKAAGKAAKVTKEPAESVAAKAAKLDMEPAVATPSKRPQSFLLRRREFGLRVLRR